jgi:hypothetical protein
MEVHSGEKLGFSTITTMKNRKHALNSQLIATFFSDAFHNKKSVNLVWRAN